MRQNMKKNDRKNKGITLIALVITIIVMLILVGVTISMAVNGGLFDYAGKAVKETNEALKAEGQIAEGGIEVDGVWYNNIDEYLNKDKVETISKAETYVGCYADVDGDGTVDGVIYADLAKSGSGSWNWNNWNSYSYEAAEAEDLKDYYVCGIYDGKFNKDGMPKEVLTAIGEGEDRFYVMALEDVKTDTYKTFYWYYNASENMSDYETATSTNFGTGKTNTATIKGIWDANTETPYGTQNPRDLWGQIDLTSGWFVPSKDEWSAFADAFKVAAEWDEEHIDCSIPYGLSGRYWSSSQISTGGACFVDFLYDDIGDDGCEYRLLCSLERDFLILESVRV